MDVKADEACGGHNHHGGGGDEACGFVDCHKTDEHRQEWNGGHEKSPHEVGKGQPEEDNQNRCDAGEEHFGPMSI